jgi:hypothetical protein
VLGYPIVVIEPRLDLLNHACGTPQVSGPDVVAPHRVAKRFAHPIRLRTSHVRGHHLQPQPLQLLAHRQLGGDNE